MQPTRAFFKGLGNAVMGDPAKRIAKMYQPKVCICQ